MITATNLGKKYNNKIVLEDLYFTVQTGKVTGFLGPNGAGKSTTMRLMLGLDSGDGLTVFDDRVLSKYDKPSKIVGILLEAKAFHPTRTARQHLQIL
ncbi:ATP-binding cassette domain-containing protein, partial [Candidatus Saccharibacteria bacterium]|nr:ATP-binding cassette domain-containing protein [Candidatus Saccharibacteria bacterium]